MRSEGIRGRGGAVREIESKREKEKEIWKAEEDKRDREKPADRSDM